MTGNVQSINPLANRALQRASVQQVDPDTRRILIVWGTEDPVFSDRGALIRHSYAPDMCDLSILSSGRAPLLREHIHDLSHVLGVIEAAWIEDTGSRKEGRCIARFSRRPDAQGIFDDVLDGIITGVSVGSSVTGMIPDPRDEHTLIERCRPYEVSLCAMGRNLSAAPNLSDNGFAPLIARVRAEQAVATERRVRTRLGVDEWLDWAERTATSLAITLGTDAPTTARALEAAVTEHLKRLGFAPERAAPPARPTIAPIGV